MKKRKTLETFIILFTIFLVLLDLIWSFIVPEYNSSIVPLIQLAIASYIVSFEYTRYQNKSEGFSKTSLVLALILMIFSFLLYRGKYP